MRSTNKLKLISLLATISAVALHFFLFDRGLLALIAPTSFIFGVYLSFLTIKYDRGRKKAIIPVVLWTLAIIVNRVSGSYEFYSEYDFIEPMNGFILSAIFALSAMSVTVYYFLRKSPRSNA